MLNKYKDLIKHGDTEDLRAIRSAPIGGSLIGTDVKIQGDLICQEDIVIAGKVNGIVVAKSHHVHVAETGELKADITASVVSVEGSVKGNVIGLENVIITSTGNVLGNIECPRLSLEDGAKFKGSIEMNPAETAATVSSAKAHRVVADSDPSVVKTS